MKNKETEAIAKLNKAPKKKTLTTEDVQTSESSKVEATNTNYSPNKRFEKDDLLKFKLLEARYQNAQMFVQLKSHEFEKAKAAWEAHGRELLSEIEKGKDIFQQQLNELVALREELGKKYGVNFDNISYHESTGVIYEHPDPNVNKK
jgi:polynucleotide 5'-kinase involved in rRNA processing